jgi:undecaprenyl-diphosphatase
MLRWDRDVEGWIVEHRVGLLDPLAKGLSYAGVYGAIWLALAIVLSLVRRRADVFAWTLTAAFVAWITVQGLKAAVARGRPDIDLLVARPHTSSFPSGHAATSFACATVLGAFLPRWRVPFYGLAALIAWSRLYVGVHFPLDVIAGVSWGLLVGFVVLAARARARALPPLAAGRRRSRPQPPAG